MARDIALTVRVSDKEEEFLAHLGKTSFHGKTTVAYLAVRDYLELHGFSDWLEEREAKILKK